MTTPVQNNNHVTEALSLLTETFKNATVTRAILSSYATQVQLLENAIFGLINSRLLANATSAQLDILGRIVEEPRNGRTDLDYQGAILLNVRARRSAGRAEDIIQLANLFTGITPVYTEGRMTNFVDQVAAFYVQLDALTVSPSVVAAKLKRARPGGRGGQLVYTTWDTTLPHDGTLRFGSTYGGYSGQGLGSAYAELGNALAASTIVF